MSLYPTLRMRFALLFAGIALLCSPVAADEPQELSFPQVSPARFGFDMPEGEVQAGGGRRVATVDEDGEPAIAIIHVQVGESYIVMLPDGELVVRSPSQATPTDRPFAPISKDDLAERLLGEEFAGFRTRQTRRYLYIYNTSQAFAEATSTILETMFPGVSGYVSNHGIEPDDLEVPLVVIMFSSEREFQQFSHAPPGVAAYYNILTNHVVMYERGANDRAMPEIAMRRKFSVIAHEGAHQILHNIGVQKRLAVWPMWLTEGMAEFYAPTEPGRRMRWKGAGEVNPMRMFELENYLQLRTGEEPDGSMVEDSLLAARLTSTGYAAAWSLTHYLARMKREEFNDYVLALSKMQPLEGYTEVVEDGVIRDNETLFTEYFGDDYIEIEGRIVQHLQRLPYTSPFADLPHIVAMIALQENRRTLREARVFINPEAAQKWCDDTFDSFTPQQRTHAEAQLVRLNTRREATQYAARWQNQ